MHQVDIIMMIMIIITIVQSPGLVPLPQPATSLRDCPSFRAPCGIGWGFRCHYITIKPLLLLSCVFFTFLQAYSWKHSPKKPSVWESPFFKFVSWAPTYNIVLYLLLCLTNFVINQVLHDILFLDFSFPLTYLSIIIPIPHHLTYCSIIISLNTW